MIVLGIDIGGSGIKGNLVDTETGETTADRHKIATPRPSTPDAVAGVVAEIVAHFDHSGPVGCTFPAIVRHGVALSAANVDDSWIGTDVDALFTAHTGLPVTVLNDADAAGVAEMAHGRGRGRGGDERCRGDGIGTHLPRVGQLEFPPGVRPAGSSGGAGMTAMVTRGFVRLCVTSSSRWTGKPDARPTRRGARPRPGHGPRRPQPKGGLGGGRRTPPVGRRAS